LLRDPESNREVETVALNRRPLIIPPSSTHTIGVDDSTYVEVEPKDCSLAAGAVEVGFGGVPSRLSRFVKTETAMQVRLAGLGLPEDIGPNIVRPKPVVSTEIGVEYTNPVIGIVTAKPIEFMACTAILDQSRYVFVKGRGAGRRYYAGQVPSADGKVHSVVLAMLVDHGNNSVAGRAAKLLGLFPSIQSILMVGIAGGVPNPSKPEDHARLGDVVVLRQSW
jgi:hypothetical protein